MKRLPVHETFYTWQGEGCHMGKPAYFIRLFGCPVRCPWCDSAGTWHPDHIPDVIEKWEIQELLHAALKNQAKRAVVTGGEPCIHDLRDLTKALNENNIQVHLETSGAFPIEGSFDWVAVSPKVYKDPLLSCLEEAQEFKLIVDTPESIVLWENKIGHLYSGRPIWLHPEWSLRKDKTILEQINLKVKENNYDYRAGYQLHKLYGVDEESAVTPSTKISLSTL
ncbi:MAG: radical SAM protein [Opitutaceae bacterium]|nr:radical SAM protein [Opitutaceae bacterium]|tara:strand:+ start:3710 stop:4378 length:669 start_codon:yes stop_codon:yes gene_type:complete